MEHGKIAFCGMNCHVKAKAEFVRQCIEDLENAPMQLVSWVMDGPCRDELLAVCEGRNGKKYIAANWDEEKRAQVYDLTLAGRVSRIYGKLPVGSQFHLRPVLELDGKEIHVESLGFLVFAAAKNERCRLALGTYLEQDEGACAAAFLESEYRDSPLLDWFTWQEEAAARGMLGLLLLMRKEEMGAAELSYGPENFGNRVDNGGRTGENGGKYPRYQAMIQILRRGYARLWTEVKKKPYVSGKIVEERFCEEEDIVTALAQAVVMYVFAEELGIPFQESYSYYVALQIFLLYDGELSLWPEWSKKATKKERGYVKELWRQDPAAGWYYKRHYLGADIHEGYKIQERLKRLGGPRDLSTDAGSKEKGDAPGAAGGELSGPGISAGAADVPSPDGQDDSDRELLEALHGFGTEKFCIAATPVEAMMRHYGLNLRMFRDVRLDRRETELLVTWFGEMEEGEYEDLLLLATVCKYLGQLKSEWEKREMRRSRGRRRRREKRRSFCACRRRRETGRRRLIWRMRPGETAPV